MLSPFSVFTDNQFFLSGLRIRKDLPNKLNIKLHIVKALFPQNFFHLPEHFFLNHVSVCAFRCLCQHFKGVLPCLAELIVQQALNTESLHGQRMQELTISGCVLKPQQILVSS